MLKNQPEPHYKASGKYFDKVVEIHNMDLHKERHNLATASLMLEYETNDTVSIYTPLSIIKAFELDVDDNAKSYLETLDKAKRKKRLVGIIMEVLQILSYIATLYVAMKYFDFNFIYTIGSLFVISLALIVFKQFVKRQIILSGYINYFNKIKNNSTKTKLLSMIEDIRNLDYISPRHSIKFIEIFTKISNKV